MARSIAAPAGRLPRAGRRGRGGAALPRALAALGAARRAAWRRRRLRIALLAALAALPLLGGGWLWLRHSSLVSVRRVQIVGVHGAQAQAVQEALTRAADGMSTLDVNVAALRAAVAPLRVVRELRAIPSFPHSLRIEVVEQLPVASLDVAGVRTALAADGVALGPALLSRALPSVGGSAVPAPGGRVHGTGLLGALRVLGAAPPALARHVERVFTGAKGLTLAMRNGLLAYFGDDTLPHAKWMALASVLADPGSVGASYVDVRVPTHPAAGFPAGVTPPDATAASAAAGEAPGAGESTVASLAAGLVAGSGVASAAAGASAEAGEGGEEAAATGEASPAESATGAPASGEEPSAGEALAAAPGEASAGEAQAGGAGAPPEG